MGVGIQRKRKQKLTSVFLELTFQFAKHLLCSGAHIPGGGVRQMINTINRYDVCTGVDAMEKN